MNDRNRTIDDSELHAYVDGELPPQRRAELDRALAEDPALAAAVSEIVALKRALHARYDDVLDEPIPARLQRPQPRPGQMPGAPDMPELTEPQRARRMSAANWPHWPRVAGLAAALVVGIGIGVQGNRMWSTPSSPAAPSLAMTDGAGDIGGRANAVTVADSAVRFARRAAVAHVVYMPEIQRPSGVDGQTEARFSQWIAGRLETTAHAPDLSARGFQLSGGRALPDSDERVIQYMYRNDAGERITVCISPAGVEGQPAAFRFYEDGPVKVFYWVDKTFGYAISGGIDRQTLLGLSQDIYTQLEARGRAAQHG
ncbi:MULTISPECIES: anti-sigma factor [Pandoraea]|uniref:anti-sigma factor family protein n=1 Tax=Pandoraea TaxID=93217 RepID=UPI001F5D6DB4|nr:MULTISPECIES: anti-sigma factor [Pandoraea]MCI3206697.1 transcriptional regulator [Pandoraea sp. LA3]MDN4584725.1 transcriptional regulator [Pandoraea capi]